MINTIRNPFLYAVCIACLWGGHAFAQQNNDAALLQKLKDPDVRVRRETAKQIDAEQTILLGANAAEVFSTLNNDEDSEVRGWIAAAIMDKVATDPAASGVVLRHKDALQKALTDSNEAVRELAAKIVFFIRPNPPADFSEALINLLSDRRSAVRRSALGALAKIRPVTPRTRATFLSLAVQGGELRGYAIQALIDIEAKDGQTIEVLQAALSDRSPFVKQEAIKALARIGHPAADSLSALQSLAGDPTVDDVVRKLAEQAIKAIQ